MKIKINEKQFLKIFVGSVIIAIIVSVVGLLFTSIRPYYSVRTSNGGIYSFREDVRTANKTLVYPNETLLRDRFLNRELTDITFVFVPADSKTNSYYTVWAVELGYKLTQFYNEINYVSGEANIGAQPIDSIENITNEPENLKIIVVPFNQSDANEVVVDENRVYLYGRSPKEMDYTVIKTILVVLGNWTLSK